MHHCATNEIGDFWCHIECVPQNNVSFLFFEQLNRKFRSPSNEQSFVLTRTQKLEIHARRRGFACKVRSAERILYWATRGPTKVYYLRLSSLIVRRHPWSTLEKLFCVISNEIEMRMGTNNRCDFIADIFHVVSVTLAPKNTCFSTKKVSYL